MEIIHFNHNLDPDAFEAYTKILIITLWKGGYTHETICCMFNKCFGEWSEEIDEKDEPGQLKPIWTPRKIVKELSDISLWKLCVRLEKDYIYFSALPEELVSDCFRLLERQMYMKVEEIIKPSDQLARKRWGSILTSLVGETTLRDYYGNNPNDNISDWSYRVLRRVKQYMVEGDWLGRPVEDLCLEVKRSWISQIEKDEVTETVRHVL